MLRLGLDARAGSCGLDPAAILSAPLAASFPVDSVRKAIEAAAGKILDLLGPRRRAGSENAVREYLQSEVLGTPAAELAARRGVTRQAAERSIARGAKLVKGLDVAGGFSSPADRAARRGRPRDRNEPAR